MTIEHEIVYSPKLNKIVIFWNYSNAHSTYFIEYGNHKVMPCSSINAAKLNSEEWYEVGSL